MSALTYQTFAVAGGTGGIGALIVSELVAQGAAVRVLSRKSSVSVPSGASVRAVDYSSESSIIDALAGVDVVISALSDGGFAVQPALGEAAKKAGVKLFVPSEYGAITDGLPQDSLLSFKPQLRAQLQSIGLPVATFFTGFFPDFLFTPLFEIDIPNKKATIIGTGKVTCSFTSRPDIASYIAYVLTHLPASKLQNATFKISGEETTLLESVKYLEEIFGGKFTVTHRDVPSVEAKIKAEGAGAFVDYILIIIEYGIGDVSKDGLDNELFPGWKPLTVKESIQKYIAPTV